MAEEHNDRPAAAPSQVRDDTDRPGWHAPLPETLPEPTVWPATVAFGATLIAWGLVTSWIVSVVGLIAFAAGIGGWIARMRHEQRK